MLAELTIQMPVLVHYLIERPLPLSILQGYGAIHTPNSLWISMAAFQGGPDYSVSQMKYPFTNNCKGIFYY